MQRPASHMEENRRYPRVVVEGLDFRALMIFSTEVEIHDISPTGVSIRGTKRLNIGSGYTLKFGEKDHAISIKGVVKWETLIGNKKVSEREITPIYMSGLEFAGVMTDKGSEIIDFIKKIIGVKENRLRGIRFKIHTVEKAVLNYKETYMVQMISLSGMLIETRHELPAEKLFPMELLLPEEDVPIHFKGRIASCLELQFETEKQYKIGIEFVSMSEGDRFKLKGFIDIL